MNESSLQNHQRMMQVVHQMKEIPELPSEAPKDVTPLERVEFPESGGVLTYMGGQPFPYKGFPFFEFVEKIDVIKKISRAFLSGLYHQLKNRKLLLLTLIPAMWIVKPLLRAYIYVIYRLVDRFKLKKQMYSDAVREVHSAFTGTSEFQNMFRDMLCMTLEMDNAYRYRFQDIIVNLDKDQLLRKPKRELLRLLEVLSEREVGQDIKDTWFLVKIAIRVYFFVDKEFQKMIVNSLLQLNLEKVALSIEDKTYAAGRKDYVFGFMTSHDMEGDFCIQFNKDREAWSEEKEKIQEESTKEHEILFAKHEVEQKIIAKSVSPEENEEIQKEIVTKVEEIYKKRDEEIQKLVALARNQEQEILSSFLTEEQRQLSRIHQQETDALNAKWNEILSRAEDNYKQKCQQHLSILKKDLPQLSKQLPSTE